MKIINCFGAPGAGKSTASSGLFYEMKKHWINAELVTEYAKELVLSGSSHMLSQQNIIFAEQEHRLNRLLDKNDVAISDSPLLLSAYYFPPHYAVSFKQNVFDFFGSYDNVNIFINRSHQYTGVGRLQNEDESDSVAQTMKEFLLDNGITFYEINASDAVPKYMLHWLVNEGLFTLSPGSRALDPKDAPPSGWTAPLLRQRMDASGQPVRPAAAIAHDYMAKGVRRVPEGTIEPLARS